MRVSLIACISGLAFMACGDDAVRSDTRETTATETVALDTSDADNSDGAIDDADGRDADDEPDDLPDTQDILPDIDGPEADAPDNAGRCNDGRQDPGEACDDGDLDDLDGCDRHCQVSVVVAPPTLGGVVIAELLVNPAAVSDQRGEWVELVNPGSVELNLSGCELVDDGSDRMSLAIADGLRLAAGGRLVVGASTDQALNGGAPVTLAWTTMLLDDGADEVALVCDGVVIDRVAWTPFVWPIVSGRALSLDPSRLDATANDARDAWCFAERAFGNGDRGTPGAPNPTCPQWDKAIDQCLLLPPGVTTLAGFVGAPTTVDIEVREAGVTDASEGLDPLASLVAEVGWALRGTPPESAAWTWTRANGDEDVVTAAGADGYRGAVTVAAAGTVDVLARASRDGGATWRYCGRGGSLPPLPVELVVAPTPCSAEACTTPPLATCADDGTTLLGFEPTGTCTPTSAVAFDCDYASRAVDCGASDQACVDGACAGTPRLPLPGEVLVTELMLDPSIGPAGQWVELEAQVDEALRLTSCRLDVTSDDALYPYVMDLPTVVGRRARVVLGAATDLATNGGAAVDRAWGGAVLLPADEGTITLTCGAQIIDDLAWSDAIWPIVKGASLSLSPYRKELQQNDLASAWCSASMTFGSGDRGTPGDPNPNCVGDVVTVQDCQLVTEAELAPPAGTRLEVPVRVVAPSITGKTRKTDTSPKLTMEVGLALRDAAPDTITSWFSATPDSAWFASNQPGSDPAEDQYLATFTVPSPGAYDLYARATADGGNTRVYCDRQGVVLPATPRPAALSPVASACDPDPCGAPPPPDCDGDTVITAVGPATCELDAGVAACVFPDGPSESCTALGATCEAGACTRFPRAPAPGEVVLSELMIVPPTGELGEWVELTNVTDVPMDLRGCALASGPNERWNFPEPPSPLVWVIAPRASMVIARSLSPTYIGSVPARAAWSGIGLANAADWVRLVCGEHAIDTVAWDSDDGWQIPAQRSIQLSSAALDAFANDFAANFCAPPGATAGLANLACPADGALEACVLDAPADQHAAAGAALAVGVLVFDTGVTDRRPGPDPAYGVIVEIGFGGPPWTYVEAAPDAALRADGFDRWQAAWVPSATGVFDLAARVSLDAGATWTYCDRSGLDDGFAPDATLTADASACLPNPCVSADLPVCSGSTLTARVNPGACAVLAGAPSCTWSNTTFSCASFGGCNIDGACNDPPAMPTSAGQLVITEVMRDSTLPPPDRGEWLEITNVSAQPFDLRGCVLTDGLGEVAPIASLVPEVVPAGGWAVFAADLVKAQNGGLQPSSGPLRSLGDMVLGNVADTVILRCGGIDIDRVTWGLEWPGATGIAMQLSRPKSNSVDNDAPANWCPASIAYGTAGAATNRGSPGLDNPTCP